MAKQDGEPMSSQLVVNTERSKLKAEMCGECATINDKFSEVYQQLERIEMEVDSWLQLINGKLRKYQEEAGELDGFRKSAELESSISLRKLHTAKAHRTQRKTVARKCSRKLATLYPKVYVHNMNSEDVTQAKVELKLTWNEDGNTTRSRAQEFQSIIETDLQEDVEVKVEPNLTRTVSPADLDHSDESSYSPQADDHQSTHSGTDSEQDEDVASEDRESLERPSTTRRNRRKPTVSKNARFRCSKCDKKFPCKSSLNRHIRTVKCSRLPYNGCNKKYPFKCDICNKGYLSEKGLQEHKKGVHLKLRDHMCSQCNKGFISIERLQMHIKGVHSESPEHFCDICGKGFNLKGVLLKHQRTVHKKTVQDNTVMIKSKCVMNPETGKVSCGDCSKEFPSRRAFRDHYRTIHLNIRHKCPVCEKAFMNISGRNKHHRSVHQKVKLPKFRCTKCDKEFSWKVSLNTHLQTSTCGSPSERRPRVYKPLVKHKCQICHKDFSGSSGLNWHMKGVHLKLQEHFCIKCGMGFASKPRLRRHVEGVHSESLDHVCDICGKRFKLKDILTNHQRRVHAKRNLENDRTLKKDQAEVSGPCRTPGVERKELTPDQKNLDLVQDRKPVEDPLSDADRTSDLDNAEDSSYSPEADDFQAVQSETTNSEIEVESEDGHMLEKPPTTYENRQLDVAKKAKFRCMKCDKQFPCQSALDRHLGTIKCSGLSSSSSNNKYPFKCDICNKGYLSTEGLKDHKKGVHLKLREHVCNQCNKAFVSIHHLRLHLKGVHSQSLKHFCDICGKGFNLRGVLLNHRRNVHQKTDQDTTLLIKSKCVMNSETGKASCGDCSMEFLSRRAFQDHYRSIHLNIRHKCPVCEKTFSKISIRNKHHRSVHTKAKFSCNKCDKSFMWKTTLKRHLRTTMCGAGDSDKPIVQHKCEICDKAFSQVVYLREHVNSIHLNLREHLCNLCGKGFPSISNLRLHMRGVHSESREHLCDVCGRGYKLPGVLTAHRLKVHGIAKMKQN